MFHYYFHYRRITPAFNTAPMAMASIQAMPNMTGYPGYYPAQLMPSVMPGMFSGHRQMMAPPQAPPPQAPQAQTQAHLPHAAPMHSVLVTRDPRELQAMNQMNMQYMRDSEDGMLSLEFANSGVTA
jgi:hypothetical protein